MHFSNFINPLHMDREILCDCYGVEWRNCEGDCFVWAAGLKAPPPKQSTRCAKTRPECVTSLLHGFARPSKKSKTWYQLLPRSVKIALRPRRVHRSYYSGNLRKVHQKINASPVNLPEQNERFIAERFFPVCCPMW